MARGRDQASWVQWKVLNARGGQGWTLKGLSRGVMRSELPLQSHNVLDYRAAGSRKPTGNHQEAITLVLMRAEWVRGLDRGVGWKEETLTTWCGDAIL